MVTTQYDVQGWLRDLTHLFNSEPPVSLMHGLETAAQQQQGAFRDILAGVSYMVAGGFSLSSALAIYGDVFEPNILTVIRYGELYGELEETLQRYVDTVLSPLPSASLPSE